MSTDAQKLNWLRGGFGWKKRDRDAFCTPKTLPQLKIIFLKIRTVMKNNQSSMNEIGRFWFPIELFTGYFNNGSISHLFIYLFLSINWWIHFFFPFPSTFPFHLKHCIFFLKLIVEKNDITIPWLVCSVACNVEETQMEHYTAHRLSSRWLQAAKYELRIIFFYFIFLHFYFLLPAVKGIDRRMPMTHFSAEISWSQPVADHWSFLAMHHF